MYAAITGILEAKYVPYKRGTAAPFTATGAEPREMASSAPAVSCLFFCVGVPGDNRLDTPVNIKPIPNAATAV